MVIVHTKRNETAFVSFTYTLIYTNKLQMESRFVFERQSLKTFKWKHIYDLRVGKDFSNKPAHKLQKKRLINSTTLTNWECPLLKKYHYETEKISHKLGEDNLQPIQLVSRYIRNSYKSQVQKGKKIQ